jgi:hypothetical protein
VSGCNILGVAEGTVVARAKRINELGYDKTVESSVKQLQGSKVEEFIRRYWSAPVASKTKEELEGVPTEREEINGGDEADDQLLSEEEVQKKKVELEKKAQRMKKEAERRAEVLKKENKDITDWFARTTDVSELSGAELLKLAQKTSILEKKLLRFAKAELQREQAGAASNAVADVADGTEGSEAAATLFSTSTLRIRSLYVELSDLFDVDSDEMNPEIAPEIMKRLLDENRTFLIIGVPVFQEYQEADVPLHSKGTREPRIAHPFSYHYYRLRVADLEDSSEVYGGALRSLPKGEWNRVFPSEHFAAAEAEGDAEETNNYTKADELAKLTDMCRAAQHKMPGEEKEHADGGQLRRDLFSIWKTLRLMGFLLSPRMSLTFGDVLTPNEDSSLFFDRSEDGQNKFAATLKAQLSNRKTFRRLIMAEKGFGGIFGSGNEAISEIHLRSEKSSVEAAINNYLFGLPVLTRVLDILRWVLQSYVSLIPLFSEVAVSGDESGKEKKGVAQSRGSRTGLEQELAELHGVKLFSEGIVFPMLWILRAHFQYIYLPRQNTAEHMQLGALVVLLRQFSSEFWKQYVL